jgi:DNA-binding transcriptional MerR regulator
MEEGFEGELGRTASGNGGAAPESLQMLHGAPIAPPEYYSTGEAGQILGIDPRQVRQLLEAGELEGARDPKTGRWRVYQRSVHARAKDHPTSRGAALASSLSSPTTDLERRVAALSARLEGVEGRLKADIELERRRADLERRWSELQRERAELLERKLEAERSKGLFRKLFGG